MYDRVHKYVRVCMGDVYMVHTEIGRRMPVWMFSVPRLSSLTNSKIIKPYNNPPNTLMNRLKSQLHQAAASLLQVYVRKLRSNGCVDRCSRHWPCHHSQRRMINSNRTRGWAAEEKLCSPAPSDEAYAHSHELFLDQSLPHSYSSLPPSLQRRRHTRVRRAGLNGTRGARSRAGAVARHMDSRKIKLSKKRYAPAWTIVRGPFLFLRVYPLSPGFSVLTRRSDVSRSVLQACDRVDAANCSDRSAGSSLCLWYLSRGWLESSCGYHVTRENLFSVLRAYFGRDHRGRERFSFRLGMENFCSTCTRSIAKLANLSH